MVSWPHLNHTARDDNPSACRLHRIDARLRAFEILVLREQHRDLVVVQHIEPDKVQIGEQEVDLPGGRSVVLAVRHANDVEHRVAVQVLDGGRIRAECGVSCVMIEKDLKSSVTCLGSRTHDDDAVGDLLDLCTIRRATSA